MLEDNLPNLVESILNYYHKKGQGVWDEDSSEAWKKKAGMVPDAIPKDIDQLVAKAFTKQLKKFIDY